MPFCPYCGEPLKEDHVFCRNCGKKTDPLSIEAAVISIAPPDVPASPIQTSAETSSSLPSTETPTDNARHLPKSWSRIGAVGLILVILVGFWFFATTVKCIPIVRSHKMTEEHKYTYKYSEMQWRSAHETVFEERNVYLGPLSTYTTSWYRKFSSFYLGRYWELRVEVISDGTLAGGGLYLWDGDRMVAGKTGTFVTPESGQYYVYFMNFGSSGATVSLKITIVAKLETVTRENNGLASFEITRFEVVNVTIIEWLRSRT